MSSVLKNSFMLKGVGVFFFLVQIVLVGWHAQYSIIQGIRTAWPDFYSKLIVGSKRFTHKQAHKHYTSFQGR